MNSVQKKTAIVTGGANGIGFHCCRELLRNGAKTAAIFDLPNMNGDASASKLNGEFGAGRALFCPTDVAELDKLQVVFEKAVEALGGLDILINNAGIFNDAAWQMEIQINFTVAILSRANTGNEASATKLNEEFGAGRALFFPSDITEFDKFDIVFKSAVQALGGLDILINNSGIFNDLMWEMEIRTNFTAVVKSTLLAYDYMGTHKGGKGGIIVNVASTVGLITEKIAPVYTATKHAILSFTVCLKDYFDKTGVSVRVMCPGATDTPLIAEITNRCLDIVDKTEAARNRLGWTVQPCEYVGKATVELIEKGANGAVWISQACDPPFEVELPKYNCIKY